MSAQKIFTRTIWTLSLVSLFNDISSEMLYPVMPIYLKSIGFTALWIGILEGVAEVVVGLSKGYFGKLSDEKGKRLPFIQLGYFISAIAKSMLALYANVVWVLFSRSGDKLGKGIRSSARDAMLSDECSRENKGKVFGFHRAMDTVGAAIGPLLALAYLHYYPGDYKPLFFIAFAPSMLSVLFTLFIREKKKETSASVSMKAKGNFFSYFSYWKKSSGEYRSLVIGLLLFAVFNSSDVFLLLMAKNAGISDQNIILVYVFYNLVYALLSLPLGHLADKIGMKKTFVSGLFCFCIAYTGMAFVQNTAMLLAIFFVYGIYIASTEGVSKAWIAKIAPPSETATAIGFHASAQSIALMIASSMAGLIWVLTNPQVTFLVSASGVFVALIYFAVKTK
ncbi:MAG: MFS transporter [Bacteroidetes bacterium]|nr:MFS transporter [Bacteroidota bacterium]